MGLLDFATGPAPTRPTDGPDKSRYALPEAELIKRAIAEAQARAPLTTDGSAYAATVPMQRAALGQMQGIVNGTAPSAAAAQQAMGLDQAAGAALDPRDLGRALLAHAGGLQGVTNNAATQRAGETAQGAQMFNQQQAMMDGQALKQRTMQTGMDHINNQLGLRGDALGTALSSYLTRGDNAYTAAQNAFNTGSDMTQMGADRTAFNNDMAAVGALAGGLGAAGSLLAQRGAPTGPMQLTDPSETFGQGYGKQPGASLGTPTLQGPGANPYPDINIPLPKLQAPGALNPSAYPRLQEPDFSPLGEKLMDYSIA